MYRVDLTRRAEKDLDALPREAWRRVSAAITALSDDPRPVGAKKLVGSAQYHIRIADYRVVYDIEDTVLRVTVVRVAHRRNAYR